MTEYRLILMCVCMVVLGEVMGCQQSAPEFVGASVDVIDLYPGRMRPAHVEVTDASEVNRLASFFPGLGEDRKSGKAGNWMAQVRIEFLTKGGKSLIVLVDPDFECWNEGGHGDWNLSSEFKPYLLKLLEGDRKPTSK